MTDPSEPWDCMKVLVEVAWKCRQNSFRSNTMALGGELTPRWSLIVFRSIRDPGRNLFIFLPPVDPAHRKDQQQGVKWGSKARARCSSLTSFQMCSIHNYTKNEGEKEANLVGRQVCFKWRSTSPEEELILYTHKWSGHYANRMKSCQKEAKRKADCFVFQA